MPSLNHFTALQTCKKRLILNYQAIVKTKNKG